MHPGRDVPALLYQELPIIVVQCACNPVDDLTVDTILADITQRLEDNPSLMSCADQCFGGCLAELDDLPPNFLEFRAIRVQASEIIESAFEKGHYISALPAPQPGPVGSSGPFLPLPSLAGERRRVPLQPQRAADSSRVGRRRAWQAERPRPPGIVQDADLQYLNAGDKVLAVADGEGRNSVLMAEQGLKVTAIDSSSVGLEKARRLAKERKVNVDFQLADLRGYDWGAAQCDVVAAIFIQFADPAFRAEIFDGMERALKPGGLLMLHGYTPKQIELGTGGPPVPELLYTRDMLADRFARWEILRLEDYGAELQEGLDHSGMSALIDLIARRPQR